MTTTVCLSLFALLFAACNGLDILSDQIETKVVVYTGCPLPEGSRPEVCTDRLGESTDVVLWAGGTIPIDTMCLLATDATTTHVICTSHGELVPFNKETLRSRMKRQDGKFTVAGAAIGSVFGPIGMAIGAVVGVIADIICAFFCRDDGPPPNRPPSIGQATLHDSTPIIVPPNKTSVVVKWTDPEVSDPEDKNLTLMTHPKNSNGQKLIEGFYYVSFSVKDSGGLVAYSGLSFQVKVLRCPHPRWRDNGSWKCSSNEFILGSVCWLECREGYIVDNSDKNLIACKQRGQESNWHPLDLPLCAPKKCGAVPAIKNGNVLCPNGKGLFGEVCETKCEDGYVLRESSGLVLCDEKGSWPKILPRCYDITAPQFTMCPGDWNVNIDSSNNTASVSWELPTGKDNSNENVIIEEQRGRKPGDRFRAGFHTIRYTIRDKSGNIGNLCSFIISVSTIECKEPDFGNHLKYDCPNFNRFGAECSVSCKSGYPKIGADTIRCAYNSTSHPPRLEWTWDKSGLKPSCKETKCPELEAPNDGSLTCSLWDYGQYCTMQCQKGFDIPLIRDVVYVCSTSNGIWRPNHEVPDCIVPIKADSINLPSDFFYYTGKCNSSAKNLEQIKDNFIRALSGSKYQEACVDVPQCQSKFVNVTCGPVTTRRRRDIAILYRGRRSSAPFAYMIKFELTVPFQVAPNQSALEVKAMIEGILYNMIDKIQTDVVSGKFDINIDDLHTDSSSLGPGTPQLTCPHGTQGKAETGTCIGCPTGRYFSSETRDCQYCPFGMYQDKSASTDCNKCPPNTNTTTLGATSLDQCLDYCNAGSFSSSGLAPCMQCPSNAYQAEVYQSGCLPCQTGSRAAVTGSTSDTNCSVYDIVTDHGSAMEINNSHTSQAFTFLSWLKLRSTNGSQTIFQISSCDASFSFAAVYEDTMKIEIDRVREDTGIKLALNKWYHLGLNANSVTKKLSMYINGKSVYHNPTLLLPRTNFLHPSDVLHIDGDLSMSSLSLTLRVYSESEISTAASTCQGNYTDAVYTIDDFVESSTAQIQFSIPSKCDAVDECEGSPCGRFHCINKIDDYECVCSGSFTGKNCEIPPDFCQNNGCLNGATCQTETSKYTCECPYGYSGQFCEKRAVDGGWSEWEAWTLCSASCGGGQTTRTRVCDSPLPDPEGKPCEGDGMETQFCNPEQCPECADLRRSYGVIMSCNKTDDYTRCTISCRTNLYFATPPLTFYECGKITDYVWNHVSQDNPKGRLPVCTTVKPPSEMSLSLEGNYDTVPCTPHNSEVVVKQLESKFNTLDCVSNQLCQARVVTSVCDNQASREKRASEEGLKVTIYLETTVDSSLTEMTIDQLTSNNSENVNFFQEIVEQVMHLEKTAQEISNNSQTFFQMTIDGQPHTIATGASGLTVNPYARCPPGSIRLDVFCAESPAGSYSDGIRVAMCPKGQYQDRTGQSSCHLCPSGFTTIGVGSENVDECSEKTTVSQDIAKKNNDDDAETTRTVGIIVGSVVSIVVFFVLCGVVGTLACKRYKKKRLARTRFVDLNECKTPMQEHSQTAVSKTQL